MIRVLITVFLLAGSLSRGIAQNKHEIDSIPYLALEWSRGLDPSDHRIDDLHHQLFIAKDDTSQALILGEFCFEYGYINSDSAISYGQKALALAQQIKYLRGEARALHALAVIYRILGEDSKSLEALFKGLQIAEENHYPIELERCLNSIGLVYYELNDFPQAIDYFKLSNTIDETIRINGVGPAQLCNIANVYKYNNQLDSANVYLTKAYHKFKKLQSEGNPHPYQSRITEYFLLNTGQVQFQLGNRPMAFECLQKCIQIISKNTNHLAGSNVYNALANFFKQMKLPDSCIYYAKKGLAEAQTMNFKRNISIISSLLAEQYESKDIRESLYYLKIAKSANNEVYNANKTMSLLKTMSDEQKRQRLVEAQKIAYQNKVKQYSLLAGLGAFLLIAFILYRNNQQKEKANSRLQKQKEEIDTQREKAEKALDSLKITQTQLIQSEKMASLGELTAGIAHEIQNPLNFVNNFSDVNAELIEELKEAMERGNLTDAKAISNEIKSNEQKINHHGKRADSIVKGMLQHSRESKGQKELTDINALTDEYLRLSYQSLRTKDKDFHATLITDFDRRISKINIVPQEIGRVLLNLFSNAFYTVAEKKKRLVEGMTPESTTEGYEPTVSVTSKKIDDKIEIRVRDNGSGIPQKAMNKIFQPFFTTKPAGQGTGLGLSLSYDTIKAHGGELNVETKEGEYSEFIISLGL